MEEHTINIALIFVLFLLLGLSAYFSASETALTAANRVRLKVEAEQENDKAAARALALIEDYDGTLVALLICNNIVNTLSASLTTLIFTSLFGTSGVAYATLIVTVFVIIFGEVLPKSFANESAESFIKFSARILTPIKSVLKPAVAALRGLKKIGSKLIKKSDDKKSSMMTEEELRVVLEEIEEEGLIKDEHSELMQNSLKFSNKEAGDIVTHRVDIVALPIDSTIEEIKKTFLDEGVSRLPLYEKSIDKIVGMLRHKDFFAALISGEEIDMQKLINKPFYVPDNMPLMKLLPFMISHNEMIAVVVDHEGYNSTEGILTTEDIVEELFGEIWDEKDDEEDKEDHVIDVVHDEYIFSGATMLKALYAHVDFRIPREIEDLSAASYILEQLGEIPEVGREVKDKYFKYTVLEANSKRILRVKAERIGNEDAI